MDMPLTNDELFNFPCDFPIKIMGERVDEFTQTITQIVHEHAPDFDPTTIEIRTSKAGKYIGVTCTIRATSRKQLDQLYQALFDHPLVSVVL